MQNSENNTDRLFRDKLLNHKVVPPPAVWDNITGSLDGKKRKRRMIFIWGISLAASLLLAFLSGWYFSGQTSPRGTMQAENITSKTNVPVQPNPVQYSSTNRIVATAKEQVSTSIYSGPNVKNSSKLASLTSNVSATDNASSRENFFMRLLSPLKTLAKSNHINNDALIAMNTTDDFSETDRAIIARNVETKKESSKIGKHTNWAVGVQASPVYRFDMNSAFTDQTSDPLLSSGSSESSSNYITNLAGGVKVELNASSRLSVQSGVNYGEVSQNPGKVGVSFVGQNWIKDQFGSDSKELVSNPTEGNSLSNNMTLKTQMGLVNIAMPEGVGMATVNVNNNYISEVERNYDIKQQAGYLEIPLLLRYKIIDRRLGFLVLGGINTNVLMSNNVSLIDNNQVIANGKIEGLNPLTFSSSVGMGINYAITNRFHFSIEPTMKIQLNSLNKETNYDSRPYAVGIYTGISYQF